MPFPNLESFPKSVPGAYERQMGKTIAELLSLFRGRSPDAESNRSVYELAATPSRWLAGHEVFDELRTRLLAAEEANVRHLLYQYAFEESCCQALFNATQTDVPFDPGSAFFVAGAALAFARELGVPVGDVVDVLAGPQRDAR